MEEIGVKITVEHDTSGLIYAHREVNLSRVTMGDLGMLLLELEKTKQDIMKIESRFGPVFKVYDKKTGGEK